MVHHPWELRVDSRPLVTGAETWEAMAARIATAADRVVAAARHALDTGWESASADAYELHRRRMVEGLDQLVQVAHSVAGSLRALVEVLAGAQHELDASWSVVCVVPHQVVGPERMVVFAPSSDEEVRLVRRASVRADDIRGRLDLSLVAEAHRLDAARADFDLLRQELVDIAGGRFGDGLSLGDVSVGQPVPSGHSVRANRTHSGGGDGVAAGAGSGAALPAPGLGPLVVSEPDLSGMSLSGLPPAALGTGAGLAAAALLQGARAGRDRRKDKEPAQGSVPPMSGMAAGAAMRGGSIGAGSIGRAPGGRVGPSVIRPEALADADEVTRTARTAEDAKEEAREAKRALIAERQQARAARRAEREAQLAAESDAEVETDAGPVARRL